MSTLQVIDLSIYESFDDAKQSGAVYAIEVPKERTLADLMLPVKAVIDCTGCGSFEFRLVSSEGIEIERDKLSYSQLKK